VTDPGVGSGDWLGLFHEIYIDHNDLPHGVIYPEIENEAIDHEMGDVSPSGILRAKIRDQKRIGG
jgi:hypothetical protein